MIRNDGGDGGLGGVRGGRRARGGQESSAGVGWDMFWLTIWRHIVHHGRKGMVSEVD